jgi:hypothetical protein
VDAKQSLTARGHGQDARATRIPLRRVSYQDAAKAQPATATAKASTARAKAAPTAGLPILTLDRFEQAIQIAKLAAERDLLELNLRAVREALRAGPPVVPTNPNAEARALRMAQRGIDEGSTDPVAPRVVANLLELERLWQEHHAPAPGVYEVLKNAVLPPGRPAEVFLYAPPPNPRALRRARSAGAILAAWAVRAGKVDDLKQAIDGRKGQPLAELPATILSAQLALAAGDDPSAIAALKVLSERLKRDTLRSTAELACHAALPAFDRPRPGLSKAAMDVLDGCAKGFEGSYQPEPLGTLLILLARRQLQLGDVPGARKRLDAYIEAMEKNASRYVGDYSLRIRKQYLERIASEYARAGLWTDALGALGRYADAPAYSGGDPPVTDALVRLMRRLAAAPAQERYRTLHDWTMPAKDRRVVRILAAQGARDLAPDVFARASAGKPDAAPAPPSAVAQAGDTVLSTSSALIDAARQAGALDKLTDEARTAAEQKIENAEAFYVLVELARGQDSKVAPRIESRLAELVKENRERAKEKPKPTTGTASRVVSDASETANAKFPWNDYLVARAALRAADAATTGLGLRLVRALMERSEKTNDYAVLASLRGDLAEFAARRAGAPDALTASLPASWRAAEVRPGYDLAANGIPAYWAAHQGYVAHPSGSTTDMLVFDYPLTGSYEVSVDAYVGPWAASVIVHDGLCILPSAMDGSAQVYPVGQGETIRIPWKLSRPEGFNRLTIQVSSGKVRCVVNGHLLYEDDDPSPISPWLGLLTQRERSSAWRNLSLKGNPTIPREVRLSQGDRLEGWVSSFYAESQPSRRTDQVTDRYGNVTTAPGARTRRARGASRSRKPNTTVNVDDYDWAAKDGVIHGRRTMPDTTTVNYYDPTNSAAVTEADQSRLYYHRPLGDGDVITYEFRYEPGQVMVHPALDRVAFLLEPEGVKLHWMTAGGNDLSSLPADNALDEPANRRGPSPLPLKPGQWNAVKLALSGGRVAIELNGQAVYERAIEPTLGRQFGLFHYKDQTSAEVRNVVLKGNWPESVPERLRTDLAATGPTANGNDAMRRARHAIVGEGLFALEAGDVVERARALEPAARYAMLADWVLPSADHPLVRLEGAFTPSYPAVSGNDLGGDVIAPAIELVASAKELGKMDELASRVESLKPDADDLFNLSDRGRLALLASIHAARGDDAAAGKSIEALGPILEKLPLDLEEWARWPELVAADQAVRRPELRRPMFAMAEVLVGRAEKRPATEASNRVPSTLWETQVKHLLARATATDGPIVGGVGSPVVPFSSDLSVPPWKPVTQTTARSRGEGEPLPHWSFRDSALSHRPGHAEDMIYLIVPLRGKFELACELTATAGREVRVVYGGQVLGLKADLKNLERSQLGRPMPDVAITPPLEKMGEWYGLRLAVDGNRLSVSINGRKVHEAPLATECDPWVALLSPATQSGSARKITIAGSPQVPDRLTLSALPDLSGWRSDEYADTTTGDNADWEKRGEEIVGRLVEDISGARQESLLRYHRPMLEDGRISYEFYYDPSKAMVHPALDRLAFLLEPEGVRIHRLTDGAYERSGLAPDNTADEPQNRRGPASLPLKPKAWNRLSVEINGDKVTLSLNDHAIYERSLEPTSRRAFGLFHYADATQARVRNVTYSGEWPRSLPAGLQK